MSDNDKNKVQSRYSFFPETPDWDAILDSQTLAPDGGHIVVGNISSYRKEVNSDIRKRLTEHDELVKNRERLQFLIKYKAFVDKVESPDGDVFIVILSDKPSGRGKTPGQWTSDPLTAIDSAIEKLEAESK